MSTSLWDVGILNNASWRFFPLIGIFSSKPTIFFKKWACTFSSVSRREGRQGSLFLLSLLFPFKKFWYHVTWKMKKVLWNTWFIDDFSRSHITLKGGVCLFFKEFIVSDNLWNLWLKATSYASFLIEYCNSGPVQLSAGRWWMTLVQVSIRHINETHFETHSLL